MTPNSQVSRFQPSINHDLSNNFSGTTKTKGQKKTPAYSSINNNSCHTETILGSLFRYRTILSTKNINLTQKENRF